MANWKRRERQVAAAFNVERNVVRGQDFKISAPDTTPHPYFSIEIKTRNRLPKSITSIDEVAFLPKAPAIVKKSLTQASEYDCSKVPLAVMVQNRMHIHRALVCIWAHHYATITRELPLFEEDSIVCIRLGKFVDAFEDLILQ
jgi:hypothetical protein